jgi:hypothetical protein
MGSERYRTVFSAWGVHGGAHTGHIEGGRESNHRCFIRPGGQLSRTFKNGNIVLWYEP